MRSCNMLSPFYRGGRRAVPLHYALVRGKVSDLGCGFADVQVIGVALAFTCGSGAEYDVGLKIAHDLGTCPDKLASVVKSAVAKRKKANIAHAEGCGRCLCLGLPYWDKLLGRNGSGAVSAVYAA